MKTIIENIKALESKKSISKFNSYANGNSSKMNVYFSDGTSFCRTINHSEAVRIAKEGLSAVSELMKKYADPQPRTERLSLKKWYK